jgi:hypothetical protein
MFITINAEQKEGRSKAAGLRPIDAPAPKSEHSNCPVTMKAAFALQQTAQKTASCHDRTLPKSRKMYEIF